MRRNRRQNLRAALRKAYKNLMHDKAGCPAKDVKEGICYDC